MTEVRTRARVEEPIAAQAPSGNLPATRGQASTNGAPKPAMDAGVGGESAAQEVLASRPVSSTTFPKMAEAIANVMAELHPVPKDGVNKFHEYRYPRMQDILAELTPLMGLHGLAVIPTETPAAPVFGGKHVYVRYAFTILHRSGEVWAYPTLWTGMSMAYSNSGAFDDKCLNKCSVAARKFFLQALFNLPTEDAQDADRGDNEARQPAQKAAEQKAAETKGPYRIGRQPSPQAWARAYVAGMRTSRSIDELNAWDLINDDQITKLREVAPDQYNVVVDQFTLIMKALTPASQSLTPPSPAPNQSRPMPETQQRDGVDKGKEGPAITQTGNEMPDYAKDPEAFITYIDGVAARYKAHDALTAFFEEKVTPIFTQLFPPDRKVLDEIYQRNVARLNMQRDETYGGL